MRNTFAALIVLSTVASSLAGSIQPCFQGTCTIDTTDYSMTLRGPPESIGDLTEVGGWKITGCSESQPDQTVKATCTDQALCKHLLDGTEVGKIVRLPEACGPEGFARITNWEKEKDEQTFTLKFDDRILEAPQRSGPVTFALAAATQDQNLSKRNRHLTFMSLYRGTIPAHLKSSTFKDKPVVDTPLIDLRPSFPIKHDFNQIPLVNTHTGCRGRAEGALSVNATVNVDLHFSGGFSVVGSIVPPEVSKVQMYGKLTGKVTGKLDIRVSGMGTIRPDPRKLINIPITIFPGIPKIFFVNPKFQLVVLPEIVLNGTLEQQIEFGYEAKDVRIFIPEGEGNFKNSGSFEPMETQQRLMLSKETSSFQAIMHFMPRLAFGFDIVGHESDIFIELDITGTAGISFAKSPSKRELPMINTLHARASPTNVHDASRGSNVMVGRSSNVPRSIEDDIAGHLNKLGILGCAYVRVGLGLNIGASMDFLKYVGYAPIQKLTLHKISHDFIKACTDGADEAEKQIPTIEQLPKPIISEDQTTSRRRSLKSAMERITSTNMRCTVFTPTNLLPVFDGAVKNARTLLAAQ